MANSHYCLNPAQLGTKAAVLVRMNIGAGLGASHQTYWSGMVAKLIQLYGILDPVKLLEIGKKAAFIESAKISAKEKK